MRKVCHISNNAGCRTDTQRWLFGGKELLTEFRLNEYDFEARRLVPLTGRFTQPDPLAGSCKDPQTGETRDMPYLAELSPYAYCGADPVNFIDPTGKDVWELDETGRLQSCKPIRNKEYDGINIVDDNSVVITNVQVPIGSISACKQFYEQDETAAARDFIYLKVDSSVSQSIFEFLSEVTSVEWSHASIGENMQTNHITSSHDESEEYGMSFVFPAFQSKGHVTTNYIIHSHPSNTPYPSQGDIDTAKFFNAVAKQTIEYMIYIPKDNEYIYYTNE